VSTLWISKPGFVTLATSIALHAAAVAFGSSDARAVSKLAAPKLLAVDVEQEPLDDAPPEAEPEQKPTEVKPTAQPHASVPRSTVTKVPGDGAAATPAPAPTPEPLIDQTTTVPAHFVMAAPIAAFAPSSASTAPIAKVSSGGSGDATFEANQVNAPARLLTRAAVVYPAEARAQEIEADVRVEIVVDEAGRVIAARALSNTGYGLDDAALHAIRQYRFAPAMKDGHPVRVRMHWTVQFRLD
jgi:protein TonB